MCRWGPGSSLRVRDSMGIPKPGAVLCCARLGGNCQIFCSSSGQAQGPPPHPLAMLGPSQGDPLGSTGHVPQRPSRPHRLSFGATLPDPRGGWTSQNKPYGVSDPKMSCESLPQFPHSKVSPFSMSTARVTGRQRVIQTCLQNACPHKGHCPYSLCAPRRGPVTGLSHLLLKR